MFTRLASHRVAATMVALAALAVSGCTDDESAAANRAGRAATTVLKFATIDNVGEGGEIEFINAVEDVSGGRLKLDVVTEYGDAAPEAEANLVRDVVEGKLDLGIAATRAYPEAGIDGLRATETPLLLASHAAVVEVIEGPVGRQILAELEENGLKGLALLYGDLRRPFAADGALLAPEDWDGIRFRVYNSPVQRAAVEALGATPVNASYQWIDMIRAGDLDGGEFSIAGHAALELGNDPRFVTSNVALWPKIETIIIGQDRWDALTDEQQTWLTTAAERAIGANVAVDRDEDAAAAKLCDAGLRLVAADSSQLTALAERLAPIRQTLADDPEEAPLLTALEEVAARHPSPDDPTVPAACQVTDTTSSDTETDATASMQDPIPDGTYRMSFSAHELIEAGHGNGPGWSGTWTLTIEDGVYALTCVPVDQPGKDCGNFSGPADTVLEEGPVLPAEGGARLAFDLDPDADLDCAGCAESNGYVVNWTLEGDQLTLRHVGPGQEAWQWTFKPWTKIG
jgi:TRAP-type C4-dicarboxylate transport system substrate-binding protein